MKNKKLNLTILTMMSISFANAQMIDLESPVQEIKDQIETIFPWVLAIIFLIVVMVNLGHFIKEGGDWKKGLWHIILYVIIAGAVVGLYSGINSISL